jgi:hypothetical protein
MSTRREQLFSAKKPPPGSAMIPATVRFRHNKKKGLIEPLGAQEKMLCALRKVFADMSNKDERWCIVGNQVQILGAPTTTEGKPKGPQSYRASGRCKVAIMRSDGMTSKLIEFSISYKDVVDDRGLADVIYFDPTTVDEVPRNSPIDRSMFA